MKEFLNTTLDVCIALIVIMALSSIIWISTCLLIADGRIDFCFIKAKQETDQIELWGHRPWREDNVIGKFKTFEDAKNAADLIECELKPRSAK